MAFPLSPVDGQLYAASGGTTYRYNLADNKWTVLVTVLPPISVTSGTGAGPFAVFRQLLQVVSTAVGHYVEGEWITGTQTLSLVSASVQPITPEEMQLVPENRRIEARYTLYTDTELKAANQDAGINADIVYIRSRMFEVLGCDYWRNNVINHYRVVVGYP